MEIENTNRPDDVQDIGSTKDFSQLCRICATFSDCLLPIFEDEGVEHELESKIHKHLPIKVSSSDNLPVHVCYQCASTIIAWNDLVVCCLEADKKLHQLIVDLEREQSDFHSLDYDDGSAVDFGVDDGCDDSYNSNRVEDVPGTSTHLETSSVPPPQPVKKRTVRTRLSHKTYGERKEGVKTLREEKQETTSEERLISQSLLTANIEEDHNYWCNKKRIHFLQNRFLDQHDIISGYPGELIYNMSEQTKSGPPPHDIMNHKGNKNVSQVNKRGSCGDIGKNIKQDDVIDCKSSKSIVHNDKQGGTKTDLIINSVEKLSIKATKISSEPFRCNICKVLYTNNSSLQRHLNLTHAVIFKPGQTLGSAGKKTKVSNNEENIVTVGSKVYYRCNECGSHLKSKVSYKSHVRIHTGERPYTCHICGKSFKASQNLKRHVNEVHTGLKVHQCEFCGNRFASKATRDDHSRTHTGERPYVCDKCGKSFKTKASLHVHLNLHTDKSLFKHECSVCNKKFDRKSKLQVHMRVHTGEKPAECNICGKCFRVTHELTRHLITHSDKKPYLCPDCGVCFAQKRYLKNHAKSLHKRTLIETLVTACN